MSELIAIPIEKDLGECGTWRDCLYLTQLQIDELGDTGIEQLTQLRFDEWQALLNSAVAIEESSLDG